MHSKTYTLTTCTVKVEFYHNRAVVYPNDPAMSSRTLWLWDDEADLIDQLEECYAEQALYLKTNTPKDY